MLLIDLHWLQIKRASDISVYLFVLIDQNKAKIKIFDSISIIHWKCIQIPVEKKILSQLSEKKEIFFLQISVEWWNRVEFSPVYQWKYSRTLTFCVCLSYVTLE